MCMYTNVYNKKKNINFYIYKVFLSYTICTFHTGYNVQEKNLEYQSQLMEHLHSLIIRFVQVYNRTHVKL